MSNCYLYPTRSPRPTPFVPDSPDLRGRKAGSTGPRRNRPPLPREAGKGSTGQSEPHPIQTGAGHRSP